MKQEASIGLFNDSYPPVMDGVTLTVQNYVYWLRRMSENVSVITPGYFGQKDREPYPIYRYASLPIRSRYPYRYGIPEIDFRIYYRLGRIPFSLVHAHCPFSSGRLARYVARKQHIPFIATFHSKYKSDLTHSISCRPMVDYLVRNIVKFYESADEGWIPQASVEDTIREYGYKGKVTVVENGNDFSGKESPGLLREQARKDMGIADDELVFLFVGQHIWEKGVGLIIDALALLKDIRFKMFFIGNGYACGEMKEKIEQYGLSDRIKLMGVLLDRSDIKRYYAAADLFLFPSMYDNAPLVLREAAAMHTPAILLNGATASEVIVDGENGFLTENTVSGLARKISFLAESPQIIRLAGEAASHTIARSWEDVVHEVVDRYRVIQKKIK